jgi:DNA invertase Pin-like site-specific DNA recombinase
MFQIIGAMAEFERALIQERVKAGLRNARAKGKQLGRPKVVVDSARVGAMRASGASWREISRRLHVPLGTLYRARLKMFQKPSRSAHRKRLNSDTDYRQD